jgi:hypothetical protein
MNELSLPLHPKQYAATWAPAQQVLYGGSAGPGKSHVLRARSILFCGLIPGFQFYLFRRNFDPLEKSHFKEINSYYDLLSEQIAFKDVEIAGLEVRFIHEMKNGKIIKSNIYGCHCQHEEDIFKYKSTQMHGIGVDEATEFTDFQLQYMATRNRYPESIWDNVKPGIREVFEPMMPFTMYATNFDDEGGSKNYLCERFEVYEHWDDEEHRYEPGPIRLVIEDEEDEEDEGRTCQFIPALLDDNPSINKGRYIASLKQLRHPGMAEALISGNPRVQLGALLPEMKPHHENLPHFIPPEHWNRLFAHDWGSSAPCATVYAAISDGEAPFEGGPVFPRGFVYFYGEILVAEPQDKKKGLGWSNKQIAEDLFRTEDVHSVPYLTDSLPFQARGGIPMPEEYLEKGIILDEADTSSKELSVQALRGMLRENMCGFSEECPESVRTLKLLRPHKRKPEKPADHPEDHIPDCIFHIARANKYVSDSPVTRQQQVKKIKEELARKDTLQDVVPDFNLIFNG